MADSSIEWTDKVWNPVSGCTRVSTGCDHCYAVGMTNRLEHMGQREKYGGLTVLNGDRKRQFNGVVRTHDDALTIPLWWRKPRKIFVNSMSDLFHRDVPFEFIDKVFAVMALCPQHMFQVLTKRPERMAEYFAERAGSSMGSIDGRGRRSSFGGIDPVVYAMGAINPACDMTIVKFRKLWPLSNVWLGTSIENQQTADERIPHLLKCPGRTLFLSCEPLLGPIDYLASWLVGCSDAHLRPRSESARLAKRDRKLKSIHWVIVGGESGPGARPCNVEWISGIVAQCKAAGVACFVKQLGAAPLEDNSGDDFEYVDSGGTIPLKLTDRKGGDINEWPTDLRIRQMPEARR